MHPAVMLPAVHNKRQCQRRRGHCSVQDKKASRNGLERNPLRNGLLGHTELQLWPPWVSASCGLICLHRSIGLICLLLSYRENKGKGSTLLTQKCWAFLVHILQMASEESCTFYQMNKGYRYLGKTKV
jgi:hypothetical protein